MTPLIIFSGVAMAISAAMRSTWSPCGLSMLSSLTPLAERGRGHRYRPAVAWFIAGSVVGGCALGALGAALAVGIRTLGLSDSVIVGIAGATALVAAISDSGLFGLHLPIHHRQVNERWLDQYRTWVYGFGFGFQIGTGLFTYIMTAGLYLLLVLAALTQSVVAAITLGIIFGLFRGLAVLLGRNITNPTTLRSFHQRFDAIGPRVRLLVISVEGGIAVACVSALWSSDVIAVSAGIVFGAGAYFVATASRHARSKTSSAAPPNAVPAVRVHEESAPPLESISSSREAFAAQS